MRATINIHGATKLHATMLYATLLHEKFSIHDATKLHRDGEI